MRQTSREAFKESRPTAQSHRNTIRKTLIEKKRGTAAQIAEWSQVPYHAVMRRMSELVSDGSVKAEKTTFCPIKNRKVTQWEII